MKELRDYQIELSAKGSIILKDFNIVYLAFEVRTGKTATALEIANLGGYKNVLFLTKKKAISSIENDYKDFGYKFNLTVINDESMHMVKGDFDLVIHDEHHRFGSFPKPGVLTKTFKERFSKLPMIFLSGTPAAESGSQWYHQFWVSDYSPFKDYSSFYKWSKDFVDVKKRQLPHGIINDYTKAKTDQILEIVNQYVISYTQKKAGFTTSVNQHVIKCEMKPITYNLANRLIKDKVITGNGEVILADTAVKMQSKLLQIYSGTIIFETKNAMVIDDSKAILVKETFKGKKIAMFYFFKHEYKMLKSVFGDDLTNDLTEFNNSDKHIALQQVSGAEGISLKAADVLVFINWGFSCVKYLQAIDRLTTIERKTNDVFFVMANNGIEEKVYSALQNKKDYSSIIFKRDYYGKQVSKQSYLRV